MPISIALTDVAPSVQWSSSLGPHLAGGSGKLNAVLSDPTNAQVFYVAGGVGANDNVQTSAGVYKTTDGGISWTGMDNGLSDATVDQLWMDSHNSQTLIAATYYGGIFKSTDGALSWKQVSSAAPVLALVSTGNTLYAATPEGVSTSTDDGDTWTLSYPTPKQAESVAAAAGYVYIGDNAGNLYVSQNGSAPKLMYTFPSTGLNPDVHDLAVDASAPTTAYASINGYSNSIFSENLYWTTNGGASWQNIPIPQQYRGAQYLTMSAANPHLLYVLGTGCVATSDGGATMTPCGGWGDGRSLAVDSSLPSADIPAAAISSEPLLIGSDQGAAIDFANNCCPVPLTGGLSVNVLRSLAVSGSNVAATAQDWRPAYSTDGGGTWEQSGTSVDENGALYENPKAPNYCYLTADHLRVSTDGCKTFDDTDRGYGSSAGGEAIAFDPASTPHAYLATANGIYTTTDGTTFVPTGWPVPSPVNIAVDPANGSHIFVVSGNGGSGFGTLYYTNDGGTTWNTATGITPSSESYHGDMPVIAISPTHDWMVFAATATEIFRSEDDGHTFSSLTTFSPNALLTQAARKAHITQATAYNPEFDLGEHLVFTDNVATGAVAPLVYSVPTRSRALLATTDYGTHWHDISSNAISRWFTQVVFQNGTMYVATQGQGVLRSAAPLAGAAEPRRQAFRLDLTRK